MLNRKKNKSGLFGLGGGLLIILYLVVQLSFFSSVLFPKYTIERSRLSEEHKTLSLILAAKFNDSEYTVVTAESIRPNASIVDISGLKEKMLTQGYDVANLTQKFCAVNRNPSQLNINSSTGDGIYAAYDNRFSRYISDSGVGWPGCCSIRRYLDTHKYPLLRMILKPAIS